MLTASFYSLFGAFLLMTVGSEPLGYMKNSNCMPGLGCNVGFFGYDGLTHLVCGVVVAIGLAWLARRHPEAQLFSRDKSFAMNILTVLAVAALVGTLWEILEFCFDSFRIVLLHIDLAHPNQAAQPSNADTVGDMLFGLLGSFFGSMAIRKDIRTHHE